MWNALHNESRPIGGATLAEGIAVKNVGKLTLPVIRELVADVVLVDEAHLERAVNAYLTLQKTMAEGAGAAGLAAMLAKPERFAGKKVGLILCGGNIDPRILASIMVRELERETRIVSFRLTIPDRPGVLGAIATRLGDLGANILEVDHRRLFLDVPAKGAKLDVTIETRDAVHAAEILAALAADGYQPVRHESRCGTGVSAGHGSSARVDRPRGFAAARCAGMKNICPGGQYPFPLAPRSMTNRSIVRARRWSLCRPISHQLWNAIAALGSRLASAARDNVEKANSISGLT